MGRNRFERSQHSLDLGRALHRGAQTTQRGAAGQSIPYPTPPHPTPQAHASSMTTTSNRGLPSISESRSPPATASVHATTCAAWTAATRCARFARCSPSLPARNCDQPAHGMSRISGDQRHPETASVHTTCSMPYRALPGWQQLPCACSACTHLEPASPVNHVLKGIERRPDTAVYI